MAIFRGSGVALVTPFTQDGVNLPAYEKLIDWQIGQGTDALVTCGTTGEPSTMTEAELSAVVETCVRHTNKRVPVIAGAGTNSTATSVENAKRCYSLGADALLVVTPYYNKTTQEGLIRHFLAIADATPLPIIVYNVPSRTGLNLLPATMKRMAEHPNIRGVKEASSDIVQITELARLCPNVDIYSGNDDHVLPLLALGAAGVISASANALPKAMHDICARFFEGDIQGSRDAQFAANPLIQLLFCEVNPIPVKCALRHMGFDVGGVRAPLYELSSANEEKLLDEMKRQGLI